VSQLAALAEDPAPVNVLEAVIAAAGGPYRGSTHKATPATRVAETRSQGIEATQAKMIWERRNRDLTMVPKAARSLQRRGRVAQTSHRLAEVASW
jgi:hypothetical protein